MASEEESTSDSLDTTKTDIPDNLLGYVRDQIVDTFKQSKFSAEIHHTQGSSPKLVVSCGNQPSKISKSKGIQCSRIFFVSFSLCFFLFLSVGFSFLF